MTLQRVPFLPFLLGAWSLVSPLAAQNPDIDALRRKLEALKIEARQLEEQGRPDAAGERRAQAEKLARHLHDLHAKQETKQHDQKGTHPDDPKRILGGLEQGIAALRALGRHEEAEHLTEIARDAKKRLAAQPLAQEKRDKAAKQHDGGAAEREAAMAQIERLALARKAMQEAGREDAAEMLERAIRVRKLTLAGQVEEARQAGGPGTGQLAELAAHAAKLWAEWGDERNADQVARLAKELGAKKDAPHPERGSGGGGGERIERLERQLAELRQSLERLHAEVRKMRV